MHLAAVYPVSGSTMSPNPISQILLNLVLTLGSSFQFLTQLQSRVGCSPTVLAGDCSVQLLFQVEAHLATDSRSVKDYPGAILCK